MWSVRVEAKTWHHEAAGVDRTAFRVVVAVAADRRRAVTRAARQWTGHRNGCPERPWPMVPLIAHAVLLLLGEGERNKGGGEQIGLGTDERVEGAGSDPELDVLEAKHGAAGVARRGFAQVFPRAEQDIKADDEAFGRGDVEGRASERGVRGPRLGGLLPPRAARVLPG